MAPNTLTQKTIKATYVGLEGKKENFRLVSNIWASMNYFHPEVQEI